MFVHSAKPPCLGWDCCALRPHWGHAAAHLGLMSRSLCSVPIPTRYKMIRIYLYLYYLKLLSHFWCLMLTLHYETTFLTLMELVQPLRGGWRVLANSLQLLSSSIHQALCTCPTHGIHGTGILNLHLVVFNGTNGCYGLYNIWMCTKAMCSKQTLIHKNCKHMAHRHECTCKFHLTATGPLYIRAKTGETEWFDVVCTATTVAACTSERTILSPAAK